MTIVARPRFVSDNCRRIQICCDALDLSVTIVERPIFASDALDLSVTIVERPIFASDALDLSVTTVEWPIIIC